jgi:pyridoxine 4-dehydrogenase
MTDNKRLGGIFRLASDAIVNRVGYGAMQLADPCVFGPSKDHKVAIAVLREVVQIGISHTSTFI